MSATAAAASASKNLQRFIQKSHIIQRGAEKARQDIFGHLPQLNLDRTGNKAAKKSFTGPYLEKYYPTSINVFARKVHEGWETEQEEYRRVKLMQRKRKGKGPPKKGAGSRSKKKK
ncbi:mitochondrial ribosomal subunit S27 [Nitzschia inconspicua]|uniref:Small ribosomal subunit protein mS33 n=1 Tax=Nitzschia inconspicua TaxID=303405 RepID=A0A9K3KGK5_9STRA|nr:mitochondrial ribosomal subunit S27 [Nitzschia inconspicua]KAG7342781.1 mitochondrial ribosomal subunit S27 [Nitzschia inconspicua]